MPIADPRNRVISETRERGEDWPSPLHVGSPGQRLSTGMRVCALCGCICVFVCMLTVTMLVRLVWSLSGCFFWKTERAGEALGHSCSEVHCLFPLPVMLAWVGRFPGREEPSAPSVSRSPPRHLRTTGRPMGPATPYTQTKFSRTYVLGFVWSLLGFWFVSAQCSDFSGERLRLSESWPFKFRSL